MHPGKWAVIGFLISPALGLAEKDEYCIGHGQVFGKEAPQVTDDMASAYKFKTLLERYPEFNFEFDVANTFEYYETTDRNGDFFAEKVALQLSIKNWAQFVVHQSNLGESIDNFELGDFSG